MRTEYSAPVHLPDLFRDMLRQQREANRIWNRTWSMPETVFPAVNIWASPEAAIVTAELPGMKIEDLDVTVHRNTLTLRGKRDPETPQGEDWVERRRERASGPFARAVLLPFRIDADKVTARFERGILMVTLPRPEADKPHKVQIMH